MFFFFSRWSRLRCVTVTSWSCARSRRRRSLTPTPWSANSASMQVTYSTHSPTFQINEFLFVCLGLTSLWNIWGHIATVPTCGSGTLTNVLPHRNAMPQTQDTTPHPVTVYRHGANLSLCYPSMWNVTLEYTATHFNVLGKRPDRKSFHNLPHTPANAQLYDAVMVVVSRELGTCVVRIHYTIRSPTAASSNLGLMS